MVNLGKPISATRPWPNFVTSKPSPAPLDPWTTMEEIPEYKSTRKNWVITIEIRLVREVNEWSPTMQQLYINKRYDLSKRSRFHTFGGSKSCVLSFAILAFSWPKWYSVKLKLNNKIRYMQIHLQFLFTSLQSSNFQIYKHNFSW